MPVLPRQSILPFFPLNIIVFPGEEIELYIFEPRYCDLVHQCEENEHGFGIIPVLKGQLSSYGTEVHLLRVKRLEGEASLCITVRGLCVFRVRSFQEYLQGHLYGGGEVEYRRDELKPFYDASASSAQDLLAEHTSCAMGKSNDEGYQEAAKVMRAKSSHPRKVGGKNTRPYMGLRHEVMHMFFEIREILKNKGGIVFAAQKEMSDGSINDAYQIARQVIGLDLREKMILLSMDKEEDRWVFIFDHMKQLLSVLKNVLEQ